MERLRCIPSVNYHQVIDKCTLYGIYVDTCMHVKCRILDIISQVLTYLAISNHLQRKPHQLEYHLGEEHLEKFKK